MTETVCLVWSFSNDIQEIPYRIDRKEYHDNGGKQIRKYTCTCPSFRNRKQTCKHISTMRTMAKDKSILNDQHFQLTDFGKKILKLLVEQE